MSEVSIGKLVSGELIVGKKSENGGIDQALMLQVMPNQENPHAFNIMLLPIFIPISKKPVDIPATSLIAIDEAPESMVGEYTKATTGIVTPTSQEGAQILNIARQQPVMK